MNQGNPEKEAPNWARLFEGLSEEVRILRATIERRESVPVIQFILAETFIQAGVSIVVDQSKITNTTISGGTQGAVIIESQQVTIGAIQQNISTLETDPQAKDVAGALKRLTNAIKASSDIGSEEDRHALLEGIEELTFQAGRPAPQRKKGILGPIIDRLSAVCAGAGGLVAVWQAAEPVIRAYFHF